MNNMTKDDVYRLFLRYCEEEYKEPFIHRIEDLDDYFEGESDEYRKEKLQYLSEAELANKDGFFYEDCGNLYYTEDPTKLIVDIIGWRYLEVMRECEEVER